MAKKILYDMDMASTSRINNLPDATAQQEPVTLAQLNQKIADLVNSAPATLDTLNELATALGDDPNFATTITTLIGQKAPLASPALTGSPTINGVAVATIADITDKVPAGIKFRINGTDLQASVDNGVNWKTVILT